MLEFRDEIEKIRNEANVYCEQYKNCKNCPLYPHVYYSAVDCYIAYAIAYKEGAITKDTKTTITINK